MGGPMSPPLSISPPLPMFRSIGPSRSHFGGTVMPIHSWPSEPGCIDVFNVDVDVGFLGVWGRKKHQKGKTCSSKRLIWFGRGNFLWTGKSLEDFQCWSMKKPLKHGWLDGWWSWRSFLFQTRGFFVRFHVRFQSFPGELKQMRKPRAFPKVRTWGLRPYFDTILGCRPIRSHGFVSICFTCVVLVKIDDDMKNIGFLHIIEKIRFDLPESLPFFWKKTFQAIFWKHHCWWHPAILHHLWDETTWQNTLTSTIVPSILDLSNPQQWGSLQTWFQVTCPNRMTLKSWWWICFVGPTCWKKSPCSLSVFLAFDFLSGLVYIYF